MLQNCNFLIILAKYHSIIIFLIFSCHLYLNSLAEYPLYNKAFVLTL